MTKHAETRAELPGIYASPMTSTTTSLRHDKQWHHNGTSGNIMTSAL